MGFRDYIPDDLSPSVYLDLFASHVLYITSLIIFKLVFNTFIHKEDLLTKRIIENHGFS